MAGSRWDVRVPNESDGFVFTSASLRGRGLSPGDPAWTEAVAHGLLLPLAVETEDPANVRVVIGEALGEVEQAEWVGCVRGPLQVADGRLALCGGIAAILDAADWAQQWMRIISVPPGQYDASLYCYASAPNGRACVERAGGNEALGAWFRRTRPGQAMPAWLHNLCVADPEQDPGHETQWKRAREKRGGLVIDFLLHLEPASGALTPGTIGDHGFAEAAECRRPEPFPLGLPVRNLQGVEDAEQADAGGDAAEAPLDVVDVSARVAGDTPRPIAGGAVEVPVVKLARVARIAWFCHPYTQPSLRITCPGKAPRLEPVENAVLRASGATLQVGFANTGQPAGAHAAVAAVAKQLAALPDGSLIELDMARLAAVDRVGRHRYRGSVLAGGWHLAEAFPGVAVAPLREALALAEALESGRRLVARDEAEAERLEASVKRQLADYFGANPLQRAGAELALKRRDPSLFEHVVARVFWSRYVGVWPLQDDSDN